VHYLYNSRTTFQFSTDTQYRAGLLAIAKPFVVSAMHMHIMHIGPISFFSNKGSTR